MTTKTRHPAATYAIPNAQPLGGDQNTQRAIEIATPSVSAPAGANSRPAISDSIPSGEAPGGAQPTGCQHRFDTHDLCAAGARWKPGPSGKAGFLLDQALAFTADLLNDLETLRTANNNRLKILTRNGPDKDGLTRGFGYDESHPDVARLAALVAGLKRFEDDIVTDLQRKMRTSPWASFVKANRGVGDKQLARLLVSIGDPYIRPEMAYPDGTVVPAGPRTVSALWAYCGLHVVPGRPSSDAPIGPAGDGGDPGHVVLDVPRIDAGVAPKRRRGERANWSTAAKTRAYLIAKSCLQQLVKPCAVTDLGTIHRDECNCSPYRVFYDRRRARTRITHPEWSAGHSHTDAMRVTSKEILKHLWREAKRLHEEAAAP